MIWTHNSYKNFSTAKAVENILTADHPQTSTSRNSTRIFWMQNLQYKMNAYYSFLKKEKPPENLSKTIELQCFYKNK